MIEILKALAVGAAFGWCLHRAGLTHYARIVELFRLRDFTVLSFMLTALAVAAVLIEGARAVGLVDSVVRPTSHLVATTVGGALFGVGMALAGYCPGTIVAEAGEGRLDAATAGVAGLLVGALTFGLLHPVIMPPLARVASLGHVSLSQLLGAHPLLLAVVFAQVVCLAFLVLPRPRP
jgi:uncharacterized membrane protein YedE/YeeE